MLVPADRFNQEDRGVSDIVGIATLLGVAVLIIAGTGLLGVVYHVPDPTTDDPSADFTFDYEQGLDSDSVTIEYVGGDAVPAEALRIEVTNADPAPNQSEFYWSTLDDADPVFEQESIVIDGTVLYDEDRRADLSGATIDLHVEDEEQDYFIESWSGHDV